MIAYFDCFSGISGNMILGALVDAGLSVDFLKKELKKIDLENYSIKVKKVTRGHLSGTYLDVVTRDVKRRKLKDITGSINKSGLSSDVRKKSIGIFNRIAEAESRVHGVPKDRLHFHEIGDLDSIVDIAGAVIGLKKLGIKEVYASCVHTGKGFVKTRGGILPVPAPATAELLKGVPVYGGDIKSELVTPTGAAIITSFTGRFGEMPSMEYEAIGYGAGSKKLSIPNMLRVYIGKPVNAYAEDIIRVIETNIDDMNPQVYDYLMERLFGAGALDVFLTPAKMKKNRPGTVLTVLSGIENTDKMVSIIFRETTTLGVRSYEVNRKKLFRKVITIKTKYGSIRVKTGRCGNDAMTAAPEYEDCKKAAKKSKVPLRIIQEEAIKKYKKSQ